MSRCWREFVDRRIAVSYTIPDEIEEGRAIYCIIIAAARAIGKKPGLKLGWVTKVNPDGSVRAHIAPLQWDRTPKWTKTPRSYRKNQVAQFFGKNVKPSKAEVEAIRRRLEPYNPRAGDYSGLAY